MKRNQLILTLAVGLLAGLLAIGCGSDDQPRPKGMVDRMVDTVADGFAETINKARVDKATDSVVEEPNAVHASATESAVATENGVTEMIVADSVIYSVYDDGIVVYDMRTQERSDIPTADRPVAIADHYGEIFVGFDQLYKIIDGQLEPIPGEYHGNITSLASLNYRLIIGTDEGVYTRSIFGNETLLEDVVVSALAPDVDGVWIGTDGQGLYRWDGREVNKRWLERDKAAFDFVNALDFRHAHLYMGTDNGLFIFDGGAWTQLIMADGLPGDQVRKIDAQYWVVYLVTDGGFVGYFNGDFIPQYSFEDYTVTVARRYGADLVAGTADGYVLQKSGAAVKRLIQPNELFAADLLSQAIE